MTYYAGLDVSLKQTSIAIVNETGKLMFETVCETDPEVIITTLKDSNFTLNKIGFESGNISSWLLEEMKNLGYNAVCIESSQMATFIALKVNKTDKNDARLIAEAMRCNLYKEVHQKRKESIEIGLQMGVRRTLVEIRTKIKNSIRGFIKIYGIRLGSVSHEKFAETVRSNLERAEEGVKVSIECLLKSFEEVCRNINIAEKEIEKLCEVDPVIQLFMGVPGIGKITAMTYKAVIDDPSRFKNPRDVGAYLGLTPKQYSSGETVRQGRISKCGCSELRTLLVECATVILTVTKGWTKLKAWGLKIKKRSGIFKAAAAVARKLAIILLRMWQTGKEFIWGEEKKKLNTCV